MRQGLLLLTAAAALAAGCGERSEPLGEVAQEYPVTVQGAGEEATVLGERPRRIVALDPGSAELVYALAEARRVVGVPAGLARSGADGVVSRTGQIDIGEVARLEPDLIVAASSTDLLSVSRAQRETGAALYVQPASSVEDVERAALELGFLVGEPPAARELVRSIRRNVEGVEEQLVGVETVTVFVDTGFFTTISSRSLLGDLVRRAGGESVAGETPPDEPFPIRRLVRLDPDVYLATSDSRVTLAELRNDPIASRLTAVKQGRFVVLPSDLVLRPGARVGKALLRVARALHPDAFSQ
ncbi:MAG: ABC transporter substrate-binding protein [Gaiellaceae bacterium]